MATKILPKKYLYFICILTLSIIACDNGEQTKIESINNSVTQNPYSSGPAASNLPVLIDSLNINLMLTRGSEFYKTGDFPKAIDQYLAVCRFDTQNLIALTNIGNIYYDSQQNEKAIEFYEKALVLDPSKSSARCDMATAYSRIGMLDRAIEINKKTVEMDFNHAQSHHNLAVFYKAQGNLNESEAETKIYNQLISENQHQ